METSIAKLVKSGRGCDTVYLGKGHTISGYGSPERPHAGETGKANGNLIIPDGTPAIDVRAAVETDDGYRWVFKGPMVDVDLPDGGCSGYSKAPGAMDYVSTREYVEGWRQHGARIGHYSGGRIVWDG